MCQEQMSGAILAFLCVLIETKRVCENQILMFQQIYDLGKTERKYPNEEWPKEAIKGISQKLAMDYDKTHELFPMARSKLATVVVHEKFLEKMRGVVPKIEQVRSDFKMVPFPDPSDDSEFKHSGSGSDLMSYLRYCTETGTSPHLPEKYLASFGLHPYRDKATQILARIWVQNELHKDQALLATYLRAKAEGKWQNLTIITKDQGLEWATKESPGDFSVRRI